MDRVRKILTSLVVLASLIGLNASTASGDEEEFPESRFGKPSFEVAPTLQRSLSSIMKDDLNIFGERKEEELPTPKVHAGVGMQEVALIASDLGYFPKAVFVTQNVPVRLYVTGASKNTLCIMIDQFDVRRQVKGKKIEEIVFTPNEAGKFRFSCPINGIEGVLVVKELGAPRVARDETFTKN